MCQEKYKVKFILQLKYINLCTASACLREILFNHLSVKWALISFPKPLCFILLLPLSIFPMCGSVLCTCAQAHTCTQHSNTDRHMEVSSQKHNLSTYTIMCIVWSFHTCFLSIWSGHGGCVCGLVCHVLGYLHPHISAPPYSTHPHPTSPRHTLTYSEKNFIY